MGKERVLWTLGFLSVVRFWLSTAPYAQAAVFTVNTTSDVGDASPGDGICDATPPTRVCTLRAAIQEANALAGADQIISLPNVYVLTLLRRTRLSSDDLTITGGGASTTIIDGNRSVRPDSGVLVISPRITVSLSGVTIRNGGRTTSGGIVDGGILDAYQQHGAAEQRHRRWRHLPTIIGMTA